MHLELEAISKRFGPVPALVGVDLRVGDRELITLLGPSGSGKTTLLRIIAGLEFADGGTVRFDGEDVSGRPVGERQIGFVFQHYALFRHLTVSENVAFGLRVRPRSRRPPAAAIRHRVEELLALMQLPGYGPRYPAQLSGGQRQRVAFARALATEPRMLLLDEPFGALDARVRRDLRRWLRGVQESLGLTTVMVTHDQDEALEVADRVVVMNAGRVEQVGTPQEVYDRPASPFVLEFLGGTNRLAWPLPGASDLSSATGSGERVGVGVGKATAYVRRHDVVVHRVLPAAVDRAGAAVVPATVRRVHAAGPLARVELTRTDTGEFVEAELTRHEQEQTRFQAGEAVYLEFRVVLRPG